MSKKQLRADRKKKHATQSFMTRKYAITPLKKRILIVGEGIHTEPSYFEKFREPDVFVMPIGLGKGTLRLVNDVEACKQKIEKEQSFIFDEVWVAFDKDDFQDFEPAILEAGKKGYKVAYSNQSIEYWFILHFIDHQGGCMDRRDYVATLNKALRKEGLNLEYDADSKEISDDLFNVLDRRVQIAYERALRIYTEKEKNGVPTQESVTTIYQLVKTIKGLTSIAEQRMMETKEDSMRKAGVVM